MKELLIKAFNRINWDNWTDDETGDTYKLGEVYFSKLEWMKEYILGSKYATYVEGDDCELDEMLDIITDLQETIMPILNKLDNNKL